MFTPPPDCRRKEMSLVQDALMTNSYKQWMFLVRIPKQQPSTTSTWTRHTTNVGLPNMQGTSEALTRVFKVHFEPSWCILRTTHPTSRNGIPGVVPWMPLTYIGETERALALMAKEHIYLRNPLTAVGEHCAHEHHIITMDSVTVLAR